MELKKIRENEFNDIKKIKRDITRVIKEPLPGCIAFFLVKCGYNSTLTLKAIDSMKIKNMEEFLTKNLATKDFWANFSCTDTCICFNYKTQTKFQFYPGHSDIITEVSKKLQNVEAIVEVNPANQASTMIPSASSLLQLLMQSEMNNTGNSRYSYDETLRNFFTYIFLHCGRSCYRALAKNLPIPALDTIGRYKLTNSNREKFKSVSRKNRSQI